MLERRTFGDFHALVGGTGRPLMFLHGFPDCPVTAVPFLEELIASGFSVCAPWLRGYAPSPITGPFDLATLTSDVRGIIAAWTREPVSIVGHDWGAVITYALCQQLPDTALHGAVTLAVPPPAVFLRQLRNPRQLLHSWYMGLFQLPGSNHIVTAGLINRLWRSWSPALHLDDARRAELSACLDASMPAPLEYYRAMRRQLLDRNFRRALHAPTHTPILALHGAGDGCVLPPPGSEILADLGHFLHLEAPDAIAERVTAWLA